MLESKDQEGINCQGCIFWTTADTPAISAVVTRGGNVKRGREKTGKRNKKTKERKSKIEVIRVT
jgi:hypothetical protein